MEKGGKKKKLKMFISVKFSDNVEKKKKKRGRGKRNFFSSEERGKE